MARPARSLWVQRTYARRRHRTWMLAMILATLGWGCWWVHLALLRLAPALAPSPTVTGAVAAAFGVLGLALAVLTVRARGSWMLFVVPALFANASLLAVPWLLRGVLDAGSS